MPGIRVASGEHPGSPYEHRAWERLPTWLAERFDAWNPAYLQGVYAEIDQLVEGSADELGGFIEATVVSSCEYSNVHNHAHGAVAEYENETLGEDDLRLTDAGMNSSRTVPHNEHFWGLHGWIDEVFARWQQSHGEEADRSPLNQPGSTIVRAVPATFRLPGA